MGCVAVPAGCGWLVWLAGVVGVGGIGRCVVNEKALEAATDVAGRLLYRRHGVPALEADADDFTREIVATYLSVANLVESTGNLREVFYEPGMMLSEDLQEALDMLIDSGVLVRVGEEPE